MSNRFVFGFGEAIALLGLALVLWHGWGVWPAGVGWIAANAIWVRRRADDSPRGQAEAHALMLARLGAVIALVSLAKTPPPSTPEEGRGSGGRISKPAD